MRRQIIVLWEGDPVATRVIDGTRPVRVGPDPSSDVVLPVSATIDKEGDTALGAFVVSVSRTTPDDVIRAPWRLQGRWLGTAVSALLHVGLLAAFAVTAADSPVDPGADQASHLAAMKGYMARIADREGTDTSASSASMDRSSFVVADLQPAAPVTPRTGDFASSSGVLASRDEASVPHPPTHAGRPGLALHRAVTGSAGSGTSGSSGPGSGASLRAGDDWSGTYTCTQGLTDLVLHVEDAKGNDVHAVFDFSHAPTGAHGSYRMHGERDLVTGEATLVPDEWIQRPPNYFSVGMHGRLSGGTFTGVIDASGCGTFSLHRRASS